METLNQHRDLFQSTWIYLWYQIQEHMGLGFSVDGINMDGNEHEMLYLFIYFSAFIHRYICMIATVLHVSTLI